MSHSEIRVAIFAAAAMAVSAAPAVAGYPERPITMIVAYSPGGGTDVLARSFAPFIEKYLGNGASITVINKPGAGGEVGFTATAQAKPDGYTIGFPESAEPCWRFRSSARRVTA